MTPAFDASTLPSATRRQLLSMAVVGGAGLATGLAADPAQAAARDAHSFTLTVLGTTDLHGNVYNWDYFKNAEYDDVAHNDVGIAKAASLVKMVRVQPGDSVQKGQALLVLEAMKMEHTIAAPHDGTIADIVAEGGQVTDGTVLVRFEEAATPAIAG